MRAFREFTHEAMGKILSKLGNTNIASIGDGTVTGGLDLLNKNLKTRYITSTSTLQDWLDTNIDEENVPADGKYHIFNNDTSEGSYVVEAIRIGQFWCGTINPVSDGATKHSYHFTKQVGADAVLKKLGSGITVTVKSTGTGSAGGTKIAVTVKDADGTTLYSKSVTNSKDQTVTYTVK